MSRFISIQKMLFELWIVESKKVKRKVVVAVETSTGLGFFCVGGVRLKKLQVGCRRMCKKPTCELSCADLSGYVPACVCVCRGPAFGQQVNSPDRY